MNLPEFKVSISPGVRAEIVEKLRETEKKHSVRIIFAIESGSRAWGFPSPDSDYDVRFVYVHARDWYLSLQPGRDVIELPLTEQWDINGWDLRKALNLLLKPNPVLLEWLSSPVQYLWNDNACKKLIELAGKVTFQSACRGHYLHIGEGQARQHLNDNVVNYKKYFYVLRPALALRWLRFNPMLLPPMNVQALVAGVNLNDGMVNCIADLIARKSEASEIGSGPRIPEIDHLIEKEFALARCEKTTIRVNNYREAANRLFLEFLESDAEMRQA